MSEMGQQHDLAYPSVYGRSSPISGNTGSTFSFTLDSERFMMLAGTEAAGQRQTFLNGKIIFIQRPSTDSKVMHFLLICIKYRETGQR